MYVPELLYPGSKIDLKNEDLPNKIQGLIENGFGFELAEATLALSYFEKANKLRLSYSPNSDEEKGFLSSKDIEEKRKNWTAGILPRYYQYNTKIHMYAKIFVFALDNIQKVLGVLTKEDLPTKIKPNIQLIKNKFDKDFPGLLGVKNSLHHQEDRIRLIGRNKKKIEPGTTVINDITFTGIYLTHVFIDENKYAFTTADGDIGTVEISEKSLRLTQSCIQEAIDAFPWSGPKRHYPS